MRTTLAKTLLLALVFSLSVSAQAQQPTQDAAPQKSASAKPARKAGKKTSSLLPVTGTMSESAGCRILNKGKRAQVCYYDVTRMLPSKTAAPAEDVPIYVSVRNHESIMWHSGGDGKLFHVIAVDLMPKQNAKCPKQAFDNEFKDDPLEPWHDLVSSGMGNPAAARYECAYKTKLKWQDGTLGDPHIIIGDPGGP